MRILQRTMCVTLASLMLAGTGSGGLYAEPSVQQQEILAQFDSHAETARQQWDVPGMAIAVVQEDQVLHARGFGVKRVGGIDPVDAHTVFQIGSTSKAFTAALVAMQADDGKVQWTDRVMDHFPSFAMYDPWVTREFQVRDLMAQHSGQPPYAGDGLAILGFSAEDVVAKMRLLKPVSSFRSEFAYVNNLFLVAANLVHRSSGLTWAENLQKRIFGPLGMTSSSSSQDAFRVAANAASPHKLVNGTVTAFSSDAPQLAWAYTYGPAGGINSTVLDMAQWLRLLLGRGTFEGKQIVSAENLGLVMSPQTIIRLPTSGPQSQTPLAHYQQFYCAGWVYAATQPHPLIWHNGDNNFMHAAIGLIPNANVGIVILTNLGGVPMADALMWKFYDLFFHNPSTDWSAVHREAWQDQQKTARAPFAQPPSGAAPAQPLAQYIGTFSNPVYGELKVETDGQRLWLTIGPGKVQLHLVHWHHDTFIAAQPELDAFLGESGFARFAFGSDGQVASLTLSEFSDVEGGTFIASPPKS
jgi:CubicO group peptidase (beta-lactamase class C family)